MNLFFDSCWRALADCFRPRVIALSLLPLLLMAVLFFAMGFFFWDAALVWVRSWLDSITFAHTFWDWLGSIGAGRLKTVLVPLIVIFAVTPVIVVVSMLVTALLMTPAVVRMVAARRFPQLEARHGASFLASLGWALLSALLAFIALVISIPLWAIPPLIFILPPLIWGWLSYRIMAFDALATHALAEERRAVFQKHRLPLLCIGIVTGYIGSLPTVFWLSGTMLAVWFVILLPAVMWVYTLIFAFSSLWFSHYCLAALEELRAQIKTSANPNPNPNSAVQTLAAPPTSPPNPPPSLKDLL